MSEQTKPNDGGPAFPFPSGPEPRVNEFHERCEGMSLRAYFAGQALAGQLASYVECSNPPPEKAALYAVLCADAIIAELNK